MTVPPGLSPHEGHRGGAASATGRGRSLRGQTVARRGSVAHHRPDRSHGLAEPAPGGGSGAVQRLSDVATQPSVGTLLPWDRCCRAPSWGSPCPLPSTVDEFACRYGAGEGRCGITTGGSAHASARLCCVVLTGDSLRAPLTLELSRSHALAATNLLLRTTDVA